MNFGFITTAPCVAVPAPLDPRCADAAFAQAHPDICAGAGYLTPHLILKPGTALTCSLGSIRFAAFMVTGGREQDVSSDAVYSSSDLNIAQIGADSGNCTGVAQGEATISATYHSYTATATLNVIGNTGQSCCDNTTVAMMVMVQNSRAMSQGLSTNYTTLLDFAKSAAERFISEVNTSKDVVGLMEFNDNANTVLDSPTSDKATVEADVSSIAQTQQISSFYDALTTAIQELEAVTADLKVIVLISDGTDSSPDAANGYVGGNDPIALLSDFRQSGGIVICPGCRATATGYALLSAFSTGGFMLNAYSGNESTSLDFLSGIKGYICAGNCTPAGDVIQATPKLDYSNFVNWDVIGGHVDLIGPGLFDLMPENGLYVDLAGSTPPAYGRMVTKAPISLTSGHLYRIMVALAGNQRLDATPYSALVQVFYLNGSVEVVLLGQIININDHAQPFQDYAFTFSAPADVDVYISIQQHDVPGGLTGLKPYFGLLLNKVQFDDVTSLVNLLTDDFDSENPVYVPPRCGQGTVFVSGGYAFGYNCYGEGCLDSPPTVQSPDPNPLPPIEQGYTPPQVFNSTKTECASCDDGFVNLPTLISTVVSENTNSRVVSLDDGLALVQAFSLGNASETVSLYDFTVSGSNNGTSWTSLYSVAQLQLTAAWTFYGQLDDHADKYLYYEFSASSISGGTSSFTGLVDALYGVQDSVCATASGSGSTQSSADAAASAAAKAAASAQLNCRRRWTVTEPVKLSCPIGTYGPDVTESATFTSFVSQDDAVQQATAAATALAQTAIDADCTASNNTQSCAITDATPGGVGLAANFPMVQQLPLGTISSVIVKVYGLTHTWPSDLQMFLRGPDGTCVGLMRGCGNGNAVSNINLEFADGSPVVPDPLVNGTYAPTTAPLTAWGFGSTTTPTAPTAPTSFLLADFIGRNAAGSWSLWVIDTGVGNAGTIAGGFEVVIA